MKMLIAVDFSQIGTKVAEYGYKFAQKNDMDAVFIHCPPEASRFLDGYGAHAFVVPANKAEQKAIEESARQNLHALVERAIKVNGEPAVKVEECLAVGDPGEEILDYANENNIDLIFAGYKSNSTIQEMLIGSTATKIARYAKCSVFIYRVAK